MIKNHFSKPFLKSQFILFGYFAVLLLFSSSGYSANPELLTNPFGMKFITIPAGTFYMGTSDQDRQTALKETKDAKTNDYLDEQPKHEVIFNKSFLLGQTEVTQSQWLKIMENRPGPEEYWSRSDWQNLPVVSVSWNMAKRFTEELSKMDSDYTYRLPTEAEWEYASGAGKSGLRPMPKDKLKNYAWFIENSGDEPHTVATRQANVFGLYDMFGNAWEWVADWYAPNSYGDGSSRNNPIGPEKGHARIRRGGSYHCPAFQTRPGFRAANTPDTRYSVISFRVVAIPN